MTILKKLLKFFWIVSKSLSKSELYKLKLKKVDNNADKKMSKQWDGKLELKPYMIELSLINNILPF